MRRTSPDTLRPISIPVWCDWRPVRPCCCRVRDRISIPVWCDWRFKKWIQDNSDRIDFNSSMVRLKVRKDGLKHLAASHFNSSMVRLKGNRRGSLWWIVPISIPVWCDWRLNPSASIRYVSRFQFQYGAIEGYVLILVIQPLKLFQFQYGAIEGLPDPRVRPFSPISIPVWCDWRVRRVNTAAITLKFQFQYGAIEGGIVISGNVRTMAFQFQYGAIEETYGDMYLVSYMISIPVWCDWRKTPGSRYGHIVNFNSSMVRLKESWDCIKIWVFQHFVPKSHNYLKISEKMLDRFAIYRYICIH